MSYNRINNITGWLIFIASAIVYLLTIEPTVSLWDCGEFIASANKLEVGHPPGAPFFLLLARFFAIFASDVTQVAKMVNSMSALSSAFTILFLFWSITRFAKKYYKTSELNMSQTITVMACGVVGSLAYTFSDTFWFSAVEGEVYALSSFFTAIVFWAILKWEDYADDPKAVKWIILIAYLMGLSIGVHLLNLLAIPAIVFVVYLKKYRPTSKGILASIAISLIAIAFVLWGIIQGSVKVASWVELFFVNTMNMPVNSGLLAYVVIILGLLVSGIYFSQKEPRSPLSIGLFVGSAFMLGIPFMSGIGLAIVILAFLVGAGVYMSKKFPNVINTIQIMFLVIFIGYSSYTVIVIRSLANTPMDENNPENAFTLLSYLNREQYGENPLMHGQYFNAPVKEYGEEEYTYVLIGDKYKKTPKSREVIYDSRYTTFFPRMYSSNPSHVKQYASWIGAKETDFYYPRRNAGGEIVRDRNGNVVVDYSKPRRSPTFGENLTYFFKYQIGHMYIRYFMWNFSGRQNDEQGHGNILDGNWITGIKFIDSMRLGNQDTLSDFQKNQPSRNEYYMIPFILGVIGFFFSLLYMKKESLIITLLFFLTGVAIILYLNQKPIEPRERDYGYPGSFYAFSIWIGLSVIAISNGVRNLIKNGPASIAVGTIVGLTAPYLMGTENWDDHDRSGRYTARDFAYNYLETCAPNALLFTNGDNDTFPLWYAQEVEGIRTDVRVVCLPLLSTDWYIDQMRRKAYTSEVVPIDMEHDQYVQGTRDYLIINERPEFAKNKIPLKDITDWVMSEKQHTKVQLSSKDWVNYVPVKKGYVPINKKDVLRNNAIDIKDTALIEDELAVKLKGNYLMKNGLAILHILDDYNWDRPIYFTSLGVDEMMSLDPYFKNEGFAYRLTPTKKGSKLDADKMYDNIMNKYKWGRMNEDDVHMCTFNLRTLKVIGVRRMFNDLAQQLIQENKKDSAMAILQKCVELMPHPKVPYDYFSLSTARLLYQLKNKDAANKIVDEYLEYCFQELEFLDSLDDETLNNGASGKDEEYMYYVMEMKRMLDRNKETQRVEQLDARLKTISILQKYLKSGMY